MICYEILNFMERTEYIVGGTEFLGVDCCGDRI